jgi:peptide/nickel transport system ATP-binding protein/oligopeptide transport system ATP-binding protein
LQTIPSLTGARAARLKVIEGQPPILSAPPAACPFAPRCAQVFDRCRVENPARRPAGSADHDVACHWDAPATALREAAHA